MNNRILVLLIMLLTSCVAGNAQDGGAIQSPGDGGLATEAVLSWPSGIAVDSIGNVFVAERRSDRIRRIDGRTGVITTVVGTGTRDFSGDGGPASLADIAIPEGIALDSHGNLFVADRGNARIRRIDAQTGIITTVAGNGLVGYSGDGGLATDASISYPFGVLVGPNGDILIADTENHVIRKVDFSTGLIDTIAGSGEPGFSGDGGQATQAKLNRPHNLLIDSDGDLVIGDSENQRIRRVDSATGRIQTLYGTGEQGAGLDGIRAAESAFGYFGSLLLDGSGNILVAGWIDNRIRLIDAASGIITTVAGTGEAGFDGDGGPAAAARLHGPYGMALDASDNLYFADAQNGRVRRIDAVSGIITTIAGRSDSQ